MIWKYREKLFRFIDRFLPERATGFVLIITISVCFALFSVTYFALAEFGPFLARSDQIGKDRGLARGGRMTAELFEELLNYRVLEFNPKTYRFDTNIDCLAWRYSLLEDDGTAGSTRTMTDEDGQPAPKETRKWLKMKFDHFECASKWYSHQTQSVNIGYKAKCDFLTGCYPYVVRFPRPSTNNETCRTGEQLRIGDSIIHEVLINEKYSNHFPFEL